MNNRGLQLALLISLGIHAVVLTGFYFTKHQEIQKIKKEIKKQEKEIAAKKEMLQNITAVIEQVQALDGKPKEGDDSLVPSKPKIDFDFHKPQPKVEHKFSLFEKRTSLHKAKQEHAKVTIPVFESEKINSAAYNSYSGRIRNHIKERLYQNSFHLESGEVYVAFTLLRSGHLSNIHVVEHKTKASHYLRQVALGSVKESSPFEEFPTNLDYDDLSFNIVISFQAN